MQVDKLIEGLIRDEYLKTFEIISAFKKIKRADFMLEESKEEAGINAPLPIGFSQTISQPATVAFMLELLQPKSGDRILDIGSGSGWTSALLAQITGPAGKIFSVEKIFELKEFGKKNIAKYNFIKKGRVQIFCSDGWLGLPEFPPFDKILVSAAAEEIPAELLRQLKPGGRMVVPVGKVYASQDMVLIRKIGKDKFKEERFPGFVFVPLVRS